MSESDLPPVVLDPKVRDLLAPVVDEVRRLIAEQEARAKELARLHGYDLNPNFSAVTEQFIWKAIEGAFTSERVNELKAEVFKLVTTGKSRSRRNRSAIA